MFKPTTKRDELHYPLTPKVLYVPRSAGKTTMLRNESHLTGFTMVVRSHALANKLYREAEELRKPIPMPITFDEFILQRYKGKPITGFLIDDVEHLLQYIAGPSSTIITIAITNNNDLANEETLDKIIPSYKDTILSYDPCDQCGSDPDGCDDC